MIGGGRGETNAVPNAIHQNNIDVSLLNVEPNAPFAQPYIFEVFVERFKKETGKIIHIKMYHSVANVPLGDFKVEQDPLTHGYLIHNPNGEDGDPNWIAPRMLDFYGNWKELQVTASQNQEISKRDTARKTQETFLHILRAFAPGHVNMLHPNITLEISIS